MHSETAPGRAAYPDYVSLGEAGRLIGRHPRTVRRAIASGDLPAFRLRREGRGALMIPIAALRDLPPVDTEDTQ